MRFLHITKKSNRGKSIELIKIMQDLGAGEIVINSIDKSRKMNGYIIALIDNQVRYHHLTFLGGTGCLPILVYC